MNEIQKLNQIEYTDHYSVFDKTGRKICDCGAIYDAIAMCSYDATRTYRQVKIITEKIINISSYKLEDDKQLKEQKVLQQSELEPLNLV